MKKYLYSFLILLMGGFSPLMQAETSQEKIHPVVILGGGVGALTSATYLERAGIHTIVIEGDTPGGAISQSPTVHNWPGEIEIDGQVLVEKIRSQAQTNGAEILSQKVINVDFSKRPFTITTTDLYDAEKKHTFQANTCIIALGSKPRLLGIPGEHNYWTRGVYSCAVCDGALYKDKTVAVIGGGDSAVLEADYLSKIAKKVYIVLRSNQFRTVEILRKEELIKKPNVEVLYNAKIQEIAGNGQRATHLELSTARKLPIDGVFVAIGSTPNTQLFQDKLKLDSNGYIHLTKDQSTSVPGVYAIGDIVDPIYKQAISAAGDGAKAALQVEHDLATLPQQKTLPLSQPKVVQTAHNPTGKVEELKSKEEFHSIIQDRSMPVVFDFYSPSCGPCRRLSPELDNYAKTYSGKIRFIKVNVTEYPDLAGNYNIYGVPTILVFDHNGNKIHQATGLDEIHKVFKNLDEIASQ